MAAMALWGPGCGTDDGQAGSADTGGLEVGTEDWAESSENSDGETGGGSEGGSVDPDDVLKVGRVGIRRLSRRELDATLSDLVGQTERLAHRYLPEDVLDPFDNDYRHQRVSSILIEGLESLAGEVASQTLADPQRVAHILPCTPAGADDRDCMARFIADFSHRALRGVERPEYQEELLTSAMEFADTRDDFYEGVEVVLRSVLQHPLFVYRSEVGQETDSVGVFRLNGYEVATRLSYFLWGTTPSRELLDLAAQGQLSTPDGVRAAAADLFAHERARLRVDRFHAMWLGYETLPHESDLSQALRLESRALIEKVIFDEPSSWLELFAATGSYMTDELALHYGLQPPGSDAPVWVEYGDSGRMGLLSHGSFLSQGAKFADTSPTLRGLAVRTRLLCQQVPPPPADVDTDNPPGGHDPDACKTERYVEHAENGACKGCHQLVDPIGFGLENFDAAGRYREHEVGREDCTIPGDGALDGAEFRGPAGLSQLLIDGDDLDACVVRNLYRMAMGHDVDDSDRAFVADLVTNFRVHGHAFDQLVLELVGDPAFALRRYPEED